MLNNTELAYYLLAIYPIVFISIIMHEIGHYIAARILGAKPKYIIIGSRTPYINRLNSLIKFEVLGIKISINPLGIAGLVDLDSYIKDMSNFKIKLMCSGGPLVNFILFYISFIFAMYLYGYDDKFNNIHLNAFMLCNLFLFILNLYPSEKSDGWYALNINDEVKNTSSASDFVESKVIGLVNSEYYKENMQQLI